MASPHRKSRRALWVGGAALLVLLIGGVVYFIYNIVSNKKVQPPHVVENVTLIRPPPPPPDQPPPPPPPPDKVEEPLPKDEPPPSPDNTPAPAPQLGLDAEGSAGGDSFGLAARPGGSEITGTGNSVFAWYTQKVKTAILDRLSADPRLRGKKYNASIRVWMEADGRIRAARLVNGSGSHDIDGALESDVVDLGRIDTPPPLEMPQAINLTLVSHN